jgi:chemotaxis protein CheD
MLRLGSVKQNLIIKMAGGAKMLSIPGQNSFLDVGQRNINEIKAALGRENLSICGSDLGGNFCRTVPFFIDSGKITVKAVNGRVIEL